MNKSVFVKAYFVGVNPVINEQETLQPSTKKGLIGGLLNFAKTGNIGEPKVAESDRKIDIERLNFDINNSINELNNDGYNVISITPVTSGQYKHDHSTLSSGSYGWGYGFSYTEGVIILAVITK